MPRNLARAREATNQGLVAEVVGSGDIDPDEDETPMAEIDRLINRYGENILAEDVLPSPMEYEQLRRPLIKCYHGFTRFRRFR
ncbi:MAG TPA: hypothetical protein VIH42_03120 [Thermoguttaceae bacterium]